MSSFMCTSTKNENEDTDTAATTHGWLDIWSKWQCHWCTKNVIIIIHNAFYIQIHFLWVKNLFAWIFLFRVIVVVYCCEMVMGSKWKHDIRNLMRIPLWDVVLSRKQGTLLTGIALLRVCILVNCVFYVM